MNAVFTSEQYTINNRTVYLNYLTTNHRDLTMVYSNKYISAENIYGINGTFFDGGNGNLTSIAIQNGEQIHDYGSYNRAYANQSTGMDTGTFVVLENFIGELFLFVKSFTRFPVTVDGNQINQNDVRFAVGGCNMFLEEGNITENRFNTLIANEDFPAPSSRAIRTAILYIGGQYTGGNTILLTVVGSNNDNPGSYSGVTAWELRQFIRAKWPYCSIGINLDGGGSTQIAYKKSDGTRRWIAPLEGSNPRKVYNFITITM